MHSCLLKFHTNMPCGLLASPITGPGAGVQEAQQQVNSAKARLKTDGLPRDGVQDGKPGELVRPT